MGIPAQYVTEFVIGEIEKAREEVFRYAEAVPAERLDWQPIGEGGEKGQSILALCRELAMTPDWAYSVLTDAPRPSEEERAAMIADMESWSSPEECERVCSAKLVRLFELYREFTDEDLQRTKWLPYNGGRDHTFLELLDYPRWNMTYHLGQIAYIQILYGDREMH